VEGAFIRLFNGQYSDGNGHINFNQARRYGRRFAKLYFDGGEFIGNTGYTTTRTFMRRFPFTRGTGWLLTTAWNRRRIGLLRWRASDRMALR